MIVVQPQTGRLSIEDVDGETHAFDEEHVETIAQHRFFASYKDNWGSPVFVERRFITGLLTRERSLSIGLEEIARQKPSDLVVTALLPNVKRREIFVPIEGGRRGPNFFFTFMLESQQTALNIDAATIRI